MGLCYAIASYEKDGRRIFQNDMWGTKDFVIKFYENFRRNFPERNPQLHRMWEIEAEGKELLRLWNRANDLAEMVKCGKLSVEKLPDIIE